MSTHFVMTQVTGWMSDDTAIEFRKMLRRKDVVSVEEVLNTEEESDMYEGGIRSILKIEGREIPYYIKETVDQLDAQQYE